MRSIRAKPVAGRRASLAMVLSAAIHVIAFVSLSLGLHVAHQLTAARPDIEVHLVRLGGSHPPMSRPSPEPTDAGHSDRVHSRSVGLTASVLAPVTQVPAHPSSDGPPPGNPDGAEIADARNALRTGIGCDSHDVVVLNPAEREACRQRRLARRKQPVPTYDAIPSNPEEAAAILRAAHCNDVWRKYRDSYSLNDCPGGNCEDASEKHQ